MKRKSRMEFDRNNVRQMVEEDRLSSLPDELIHKIMYCFDMKYAVQTCLLSSRCKLLWTSMPCLNFSSKCFDTLPDFDKFVTHVLSHRNHQIQVSSIKLHFRGVVDDLLSKKIANDVFSHNVKEPTVVSSNSHSRNDFTLTCNYMNYCYTLKTPLDFPIITTLNLDRIMLWDDLFSKCINLKNLALKYFIIMGDGVFDIITPRLSNLMLIDGQSLKAINVIAPQLENLTVNNCSVRSLNAPQGISYFRYSAYTSHPGPFGLLEFSNDGFHSLNKVSISLSMYYPDDEIYMEEDARKVINMLQKLQSVRYLTLDVGTVECISSFPDIFSHYSSPFSNLICLTLIDYGMRKYHASKVKMCTEARTFLLEKSPNASVIMKPRWG